MSQIEIGDYRVTTRNYPENLVTKFTIYEPSKGGYNLTLNNAELDALIQNISIVNNKKSNRMTMSTMANTTIIVNEDSINNNSIIFSFYSPLGITNNKADYSVSINRDSAYVNGILSALRG